LGRLRLKRIFPLSILWERADRLERYSSALVTLARRQLTESNSFEKEMQVITEVAANTLHVERVSIWLYRDNGLILENIDLFERSRRRHSREKSLRSIDYPQYFRALELDRAIAAEDAQLDPRTSEYLDEYLLPKGIKSLLDAPVRAAGRLIGIVCLESVGRKRKWSVDEQNFASSIADIVANCFETSERLRAKEELKTRLEFERILLTIANRFINVSVPEISRAINEALKIVGEFIGVDRCYVYRFNPDGTTMSLTNEWCNTGVDHKINERQFFPLAAFPWGTSQIKARKEVRFEELEEIPSETDRNNWRYFGVKSLIWVPLLENGRAFGFIGCTAASNYRCWSEESVHVLRLVSETLSNMYGRERDLREREQALEERRKLESRMQHTQKLESLGLLAGGIAHDFNNLLMGLLGNTGLLLLDIPENSQARERLEQIKKTAERAAELTAQLLAYSGKGRFIVEPLDLNSVVSEMLGMLGPVVSPRARVELNFDRELPQVEVDATQIRQVVMNLITNASDALGDAEGVISLTTGCRFFTGPELRPMLFGDELPEGRYVFLEVKDSGSGMSQETLAKIFDPFFTTKFTGRGLGLAAVHGIIRGHRGAIGVESEKGKGTTFKVLLPEMKSISDNNPAMPSSSPAPAHNTTVLVIDDEEQSGAVVGEMLEHMGARVLHARSGEEGIELYNRQGSEISLVLVDLTMPGMDGVQTFTELRKSSKDLPIIVMSGYSQTDLSAQMKIDDSSAFLQKPFGPAVLRELVEPFLRKDRPRLRLIR
jgi:signal transduction histidine kinase